MASNFHSSECRAIALAYTPRFNSDLREQGLTETRVGIYFRGNLTPIEIALLGHFVPGVGLPSPLPQSPPLSRRGGRGEEVAAQPPGVG